MNILEENHHSFLIVEHDPLLYASAQDPHLQKMTELADLGVLPPLRVAGAWAAILHEAHSWPGRAAPRVSPSPFLEMLLGLLDVAALTVEGEAVRGLRVLRIDLVGLLPGNREPAGCHPLGH